MGEVTPEQVRIAHEADHIFIEEIKAAGLYRKISQAFAALLPVKAVGVTGDKRVHDQVIALRAVETSDFMTADWYPFDGQFLKKVSRRIVNEVEGVCRVVYDSKSLSKLPSPGRILKAIQSLASLLAPLRWSEDSASSIKITLCVFLYSLIWVMPATPVRRLVAAVVMLEGVLVLENYRRIDISLHTCPDTLLDFMLKK